LRVSSAENLKEFDASPFLLRVLFSFLGAFSAIYEYAKFTGFQAIFLDGGRSS
jgi:hypothetical protein